MYLVQMRIKLKSCIKSGRADKYKKKPNDLRANQLWNNSFVICNIAQRFAPISIGLNARNIVFFSYIMASFCFLFKHFMILWSQFVFQTHLRTRIFPTQSDGEKKTRTHYLWSNSLANRLLYNSMPSYYIYYIETFFSLLSFRFQSTVVRPFPHMDSLKSIRTPKKTHTLSNKNVSDKWLNVVNDGTFRMWKKGKICVHGNTLWLPSAECIVNWTPRGRMQQRRQRIHITSNMKYILSFIFSPLIPLLLLRLKN